MKRFFKSVKKKIDSKYVALVEKKPSQPKITWKHIWPLDETQSALSRSVFAEIPNEIIIRIFKFLSVPDLCKVSLVCRLFKMIADQDGIWQLKCDTSTKLYSKSFKQVYMDWIHLKCLRNAQVQTRDSSYASFCMIIELVSYPIRPNGKHLSEIFGGFQQHPNSSESTIIEQSVDIGKTALQLIFLLEKASEFQPAWQESIILKQMITRYYRFMQLKASHPSHMLLIPTLDIELVRQTHLLRPEMYQADCLRLFRRIIDHSLLFSDVQNFSKEQAFKDTCHLYEQRFGEQYCLFSSVPVHNSTPYRRRLHQYLLDSFSDTEANYPYWDNTHFKFSSESPESYENPFSFTEGDIIIDSQWLNLFKKFMLDVTKEASVTGYYSNIPEVIDLRCRAISLLTKLYERFLYMAAKYPLENGNGFILPTYAIDIMWHSHMQEPLKYVADCNRFIGYVLYHSPWPMMQDDKMKTARNQSDNIWRDEFEVDIMTDHLFQTFPDIVHQNN